MRCRGNLRLGDIRPSTGPAHGNAAAAVAWSTGERAFFLRCFLFGRAHEDPAGSTKRAVQGDGNIRRHSMRHTPPQPPINRKTTGAAGQMTPGPLRRASEKQDLCTRRVLSAAHPPKKPGRPGQAPARALGRPAPELRPDVFWPPVCANDGLCQETRTSCSHLEVELQAFSTISNHML